MICRTWHLGVALPLALSGAFAAGMEFRDVTAESGLDYVNVCGAPVAEKGWIVEYMGAGAAWLDYDGDSKLDLYVVNGSKLDRASGQGEPNRMYRGDGRGRFTDVTEATGTGDRGWGHGVAVGDYDNDGDPDLYVTNLGANVLYRNRGDGTFEDVTDVAGVGDTSWGTAATFFDMDGDGDLDLYVGNYVRFVQADVPRRGTTRAKPPFCAFKGIPVFCGPRGLPPAQNVLYRNDGKGKFSDVTKAAGMWLDTPRYTLGVVGVDFDDDGDMDLYEANDSVVNSLWRNDGGGRFEDVGLETLTALDQAGNPQGSMGVDAGDYDGDGWFDLVVTNFSHDLNTVYRSQLGKYFADESTGVGMTATVMELSWGTGFHDFDNDGDLDLFIANGHVYPEVDTQDYGTRYRQRNHLFANTGGKFAEIGRSAGKALALERSWRGAAFGDYDADGDVDIVVTALDEPLQLLRNDSTPAGHYLAIRLEGTRSNRDGVGTRLSVKTGNRTQVLQRRSGGSYLSASSPVLHVGLGQATAADELRVRWPGGAETVLRDVAGGRVLVLREPAAAGSASGPPD